MFYKISKLFPLLMSLFVSINTIADDNKVLIDKLAVQESPKTDLERSPKTGDLTIKTIDISHSGELRIIYQTIGKNTPADISKKSHFFPESSWSFAIINGKLTLYAQSPKKFFSASFSIKENKVTLENIHFNVQQQSSSPLQLRTETMNVLVLQTELTKGIFINFFNQTLHKKNNANLKDPKQHLNRFLNALQTGPGRRCSNALTNAL